MLIAHRVLPVLKWLREREPVVLVSLFLIVAATWGFIVIADQVLEGDQFAFDKWMLRELRRPDNPAVPVGPGWLQEMGRDASALGGVGALTMFTLIIAGYLGLDRRLHMVAFLLAATVSGMLVSFGLKYSIARPRPEVVPHLSYVATSSFPSGHSMMSAVVYLTLGSLLAASTARKSLKIYVLSVALMLSMIVGVSRVYLGVHFPTDVMAGWMAGLAWSLMCWLTARWLQRHHQVENER